MPSVTIARVADGDDFERLRQLLIEYERALPADLRHGRAPDLRTVRETYAEPNVAFLAIAGAERIGCVGVIRRDESTAVLQRLYAKPAHRGLGAGRALVAAAIAFARAGGCTRLVLDTHADRLPAAYALYRSLGFSESSPYDAVSYECPTYMELRL